MAARPHNFSAGPAALPEPVLRQAAEEMLDWHGCGVGVMEMSHRSPQFARSSPAPRRGCASSWPCQADFDVLFMQGGAIGQNAIVPMNLSRGRPTTTC
jgi:phosphoserine aminotransferase